MLNLIVDSDKRALRSHIKNGLNLALIPVVLVIIGLLIAGIYPNKVREEDYLHIDIGNMRVFTYKYGLAIYEKGTHLFYNISPYDMYFEENPSIFNQYVSANTLNASLFSWTDHILSAESRYNNFWKKYYRTLSYFDLARPSATFTKDNQKAIVTAYKSSPQFLTFALNYSQLTERGAAEMSFSLNDEDIFIDDQKNIYTQSPESLQSFLDFNGAHKYAFKDYQDIPTPLYTSYLIVSNPVMTGFYKIKLPYGKIYINTPGKKVNFFVNSAIPKFDIEIGDYLAKEVAKQ